METAGTPYSALPDIDANKPSGSIKIRVKTYGYTLKLAEEKIQDTAQSQHVDEQTSVARRLELLAMAPAEIRHDQRYLAEVKKWRERQRELKQDITTPKRYPVIPIAKDSSPQPAQAPAN